MAAVAICSLLLNGEGFEARALVSDFHGFSLPFNSSYCLLFAKQLIFSVAAAESGFFHLDLYAICAKSARYGSSNALSSALRST